MDAHANHSAHRFASSSEGSGMHDRQHGRPYLTLAAMAAIHILAMYALMYSMVDRFNDVFMSFNQLYMAATMTAPMILIELLLMRSMYRDKRLNLVAGLVCFLVLIIAFMAIRTQLAIADTQFVRSMIPHHSGAILMCRRARLTDTELLRLCQEIMRGQQREIDQMRIALDRLQ